MNKNLLQFLAITLVAGCLCSCDVEDCISTKSSGVIVEYIHQQSNDDLRLSVIIDYLQAEGNEIILVDDSSRFFIDTLYLNPGDNNTRYNLEINQYRIDTSDIDPTDIYITDLGKEAHTISLSYTRRQRIISQECGVEQSFYNLEIVDHDFDSAVVVNDTIDRFNPVNVQIYF